MMSKDTTFDMHDAPAHIRAIRPRERDWIGAYSQFIVAGATDVLLRRIEFPPPGAYRMPLGSPNPLTKELQHTSQRSWLPARNPLLHPLSMVGFTTNPEFL